MEHLPYGGQSPQDKLAFEQYKMDLIRGKGLVQLQAIADGLTPDIRRSWSPGTFTPVTTSDGKVYDAITCTISYHYNKHGYLFGSVAAYTNAARQYFTLNRHSGKSDQGTLRFEKGRFELDGRILTFNK